MTRFFSQLKSVFSPQNLPSFLIIGAQKAGTTTLYDILNSHPSFCGSLDKESAFFTNDVYYEQGKAWYSKQFELCGRNTLKFEATPFYLYHPDTPKRIFEFNPDMKFIVVLREPSSRCYSAWNMFRRFNATSPNEIFDQFVKHSNPEIREATRSLLFTKNYPSFKQAVEDDLDRYLSKSQEIEPAFVRRGIYVEQVLNYLQFFSIKNFLFLEQRELNSYIPLFKKLGDFFQMRLNVDLPINPQLSNPGEYLNENAEAQETLSFLKEFYKPHNDKLFAQIGIQYDWNEPGALR